MEGEIAWRSPVPVYRQLAEMLRDAIAAGQLEVGPPLPSKRDLMQRYGVGEHTVGKAVRLPKDEGLVETTQCLGVFVVRKP
jgi:DNA-binding GntR family transcriptional regulator